jgi:hypothetical protein
MKLKLLLNGLLNLKQLRKLHCPTQASEDAYFCRMMVDGFTVEELDLRMQKQWLKGTRT